MINASPFANVTADGRTVVDELPRRNNLLPGEVQLVVQHLLDTMDALFAGTASASELR